MVTVGGNAPVPGSAAWDLPNVEDAIPEVIELHTDYVPEEDEDELDEDFFDALLDDEADFDIEADEFDDESEDKVDDGAQEQELPETPAPTTRIGPGTHCVVQGECLTNIAYRAGFFEDTLRDHSANAELRRNRDDANYLQPGDKVVIPELRSKHEPGATETRHRFRRKGVPAKLEVRLMYCGVPRSEVDYVLYMDGDAREGRTDKGGWVSESIPPDAQRARIIFDLGEDEYDIVLGAVDPIDTVSGVQRRLLHLGYACKVTGVLDEQTRAALRESQADHDLEPCGDIDDPTVKKLKAAHEDRG